MVVGGSGAIALDVAGGLIVAVTVADMFLTIFNYDGYPTLTTLFHRGWWRVLRVITRPLPTHPRHVALSIGSASMLPATVALWLGLQVAGFALVFTSGLHGNSFTLKGPDASVGTAFYLSGGAISSLSFGDVVARAFVDRALLDLETTLGLATFTLGLGYVVTAFGILSRLENLHGRVSRHAVDLERPESILARHFRGGSPRDLPAFLQALADNLEDYDQGLRRYPVVYFFHTRRTSRAIPTVFTAIGDLVALLRWGLPRGEPMTQDAYLLALHDEYLETLDRLRISFVGPDPIEPPAPLDRAAFESAYRGETNDAWVDGFRTLEDRGRAAAGADGVDPDGVYERYRDWLPFAFEQRSVLDRVANRLGYERPEPVALRSAA